MSQRRAHALALIGRIEQQELDRRRLALVRAEDRLGQVEAQLARQEETSAREVAIAWQLPDGQRLLACFASGDRLLRARLQAEQAQLKEQREQGRAAVAAQRPIVRRWEISAERVQAEMAASEAKHVAAAIDELALLRHVHRRQER